MLPGSIVLKSPRRRRSGASLLLLGRRQVAARGVSCYWSFAREREPDEHRGPRINVSLVGHCNERGRGATRMRGRQVIVVGLAAWDLVWRAAAVRQAIRTRQYKWAAALLIISSGGALPMFYLARSRKSRK